MDEEKDLLNESKEKTGLLSFRELLSILLFSALTECLFILITVLTVRNLSSVVGNLISPDDELVRIFSDLKTAVIRPHPLIPFFICFSGLALIHAGIRFPKTAPRRSFLNFVAGLLMFLLGAAALLFSLAFTLWMTGVNDIRFGDVLLSLLRQSESGALDLLARSSIEVPLCV